MTSLLADVGSLPSLTAGPRPPPDSGEVELWYCFHEQIEPSWFEAYEQLLTADEQARHLRYYFARDRRQFLVTRALVRCVLSQYADVDPAAWRFGQNAYGRPRVEGPVTSRVHFNLSNTSGLITCAVSSIDAVGVDVEATDRRTEPRAIAHRFFSDAEAEGLLARPTEAQQRERFFSLWTLKEAYIKARGMGLAIPLGRFSFVLDQVPPIRVALDPRLDDDADRWHFALLRASERHFVAVALASGSAPMRLSAAEVVPLRDVPSGQFSGSST